MMIETNNSSPLSILIGSFNTHKLFPPDEIDLSPWLIHKSHTPHIIAIGLQELPFFQSKKFEYQWQKLIERTLPNYQLLSHVRLNSLLLFIYIQSLYLNQCSSIGTARVSTGFLNLYGNKGCVGIRFDFNKTSLCFLNVHLSAGENVKSFQLRNEQYSSIHQRILLKSLREKFQWNFNEHNGIFFFGDLNYRQTETNEDELKQKTKILKTYSEAKIKFPPTYKYKLNSDSYNLLRRPSWTDRILYKTNQCHIESIDYWAASTIRCSDHRPITNLFFLKRLFR